MSEQIVSEASAWQGTIEGDYRESAQIFAWSPPEVFIRRRLNLHPSSFWQGCPKTDQYLTKRLPHRLTRDASKNATQLLGRYFEHYFFAVGQRFNQVSAGKQFICCQIKPNILKQQFTHSSHLKASPMTTQGVSQTAGRKGTFLTATSGPRQCRRLSIRTSPMTTQKRSVPKCQPRKRRCFGNASERVAFETR